MYTMKDNGWESLLQEVNSFCDKHFINIPNMEDIFFSKGRDVASFDEFGVGNNPASNRPECNNATNGLKNYH